METRCSPCSLSNKHTCFNCNVTKLLTEACRDEIQLLVFFAVSLSIAPSAHVVNLLEHPLLARLGHFINTHLFLIHSSSYQQISRTSVFIEAFLVID